MATITTADNEIHVGDVGSRFEVTVKDDDTPVSLVGASELTFIFQKPDRTTFSRTATVLDAAAGQLYYDTVDGDLDQAGRWRIQLYMDLPAFVGHTDVCSFKVYSNL